MKRTIVVVDGLGGGAGALLVAKLREVLGKGTELIALGTNSAATERMLKAGADRGASGENAIAVSVSLGDIVMGPIGIVLPNSMMGEVTPAVAQAVLAAPGRRILLPLQQGHFILAGTENRSLGELAEAAAAEAAALLATPAGTA